MTIVYLVAAFYRQYRYYEPSSSRYHIPPLVFNRTELIETTYFSAGHYTPSN